MKEIAIKEIPVKLRKPNNKYMKAYIKAVKKGYAKLEISKKSKKSD